MSRRAYRCGDQRVAAIDGQVSPRAEIVLAIEHVYYFYNEDTKHHFHVWVVPRHPWMRKFGRSIESVRPALLHARDDMSGQNKVAEVERAADLLRKTLSV
jgi:hypothetical protein